MDQFKCDQCEKYFKLKRTLQSHMLIHSGEKPFKCSKCVRTFRQQSSLQKHDRTHTGNKPYECKSCDAKFTQLSNLKRHENIHKIEKPYMCDDCGKSFITLQNKQQHIAKHTSDRQEYSCEDGCGKKFLYKCSLKKHKKITHQQMSFDQFFGDSAIQAEKLKEFFTNQHPQILHKNHIDILFNGRLYSYDEGFFYNNNFIHKLETGKIEVHDLKDNHQTQCEPVKDHQTIREFQNIGCTSCVDNQGQENKIDCCKNCANGCQDCCLACNKGNCQDNPAIHATTFFHDHGPNCGHPIVFHNGHVDYLVNEILHYPHDGHCDNHGILNRIRVQ